jgi:hypothetical protein
MIEPQRLAKKWWCIPLLGGALTLSGCGFGVPNMRLSLGDDAKKEGLRESNLVAFVKCQLHEAVQHALDQDARDEQAITKGTNGTPEYPHLDWLRSWGAAVSMKIVVDEKSTVAPGITLNSPMENVVSSFASGGNVTASQSFNLGIGASFSSDATRTETVSFYFPFQQLLDEEFRPHDKSDCKELPQFPKTLDGDLKLEDFMMDKYYMATNTGVLLKKPAKAGAKFGRDSEVNFDSSVSPFDTFTYEVQFVVAESGSLTPAWKLIRISANNTGTLFNGGRTRTDDILFTMGKAVTTADGKNVQPSTAAANQNLANLIGQAVAASLRNQMTP